MPRPASLVRSLPLVAVAAVALAGYEWRWQLRGAAESLAAPTAASHPAIDPPGRIAHAGGRFRGLPYTNAIAAFEASYQRGARWFEVDGLRDPGGTWWAVHDWKDPAAPLAPRLAEVVDWLAVHRDAHLVTDTKGDNRALLRWLRAAPAPVRARIHPQIYLLSEYADTEGLAAPIFTTYRSRYPWWTLRRFAAGRVLAVAVTREEAFEAAAALRGAAALLVHTVNDAAEEARLRSAGIAGIYTDDLLP